MCHIFSSCWSARPNSVYQPFFAAGQPNLIQFGQLFLVAGQPFVGDAFFLARPASGIQFGQPFLAACQLQAGPNLDGLLWLPWCYIFFLASGQLRADQASWIQFGQPFQASDQQGASQPSQI